MGSSGEPLSQVSEGKEQCKANKDVEARLSESGSDDNLEKFLVNLKSTSKSKMKVPVYDSDSFIVPDDDSDYYNSPKMSLKDRIQKKLKVNLSSSVRATSYRSPVKERNSKEDMDVPNGCGKLDSLDKKQLSKLEIKESPKLSLKERIDRKLKDSPQRKQRLESSSDGGDSLPDVEIDIGSRKSRKVKKTHIIYSSDSEEDDSDEKTPVIPISSDDEDGFVNIYEAGNHHLIPESDSPALKDVITKPKFKKPPVTSVKKPKAGPIQVMEDQSKFSTPTLTFLSSLTIDTPLQRCHPAAVPYVKNFAKKKTELAKRLYTLYNSECFDSALPEDMEISWNVRLTKTAGLCYSRRHRNRHNIEVRSSRIELSTKVIDSGDRLRDTLIHEMCHAASWIISGYRDGHGPLWKTWAEKAMTRFPELPVIDRCHSYQIRTKYTYRCEKCGYSIGRHSKSLDTEKKVCGHCFGRFQLVVNGKTLQAKALDNGTDTAASNGKTKTPNAFALFVKDNYKVYKQPGVSHGDVMKTLSAKFSETKITKK